MGTQHIHQCSVAAAGGTSGSGTSGTSGSVGSVGVGVVSRATMCSHPAI